jgi:hypothetical protein
LQEVGTLLNGGPPEMTDPLPPPSRSISEADLERMIDGATSHILATANLASSERIWPTTPFGATTDPLNVQHGAAGVLAVLARIHAADSDPVEGELLADAASWVVRRVAAEPRFLPGLYFGRSGTAWALLEVGLSLGDPRLVEVAADLARRIPVCWANADVCHGTAGAGLTQLRFWEATGAEDFLDRARAAASRLIEVARYRDGNVAWPVPRDFDSTMAGVAQFGFAHGVAGVGAFLLAAARATGDRNLRAVASQAAQTLVRAAQVEGRAAYWPAEEGGPRQSNWCNGSSGVGTFLVRMWQETGEDRLAELAAQAAVAIRRSRWKMGTAQCHGLAGDGEFLLDLSEAFGDERYRAWAGELALNIWLRHGLRDGRTVVPDESGVSVLADYNTGLSGVLAFLRRLRDGGARMWLPGLLSCIRGAGDRPLVAANVFAGADLAPARNLERR